MNCMESVCIRGIYVKLKKNPVNISYIHVQCLAVRYNVKAKLGAKTFTHPVPRGKTAMRTRRPNIYMFSHP